MIHAREKSNRTASVTTKITPEQEAGLQALADAKGVTVSEYAREVLLRALQPESVSTSPEYQVLLRELQSTKDELQRLMKNVGNVCLLVAQRIGITVEQLAPIVNAGKLPQAPPLSPGCLE